MLLARLVLFALLSVAWLTHLSVRGAGRLWPVWTAAAVVLAVAAYRLLRLRRWRAGPRADLLLARDGVTVDDLFVPWYQVEGVVRFHFVAPFERRGTRNFLALQVRDFVAVQRALALRGRPGEPDPAPAPRPRRDDRAHAIRTSWRPRSTGCAPTPTLATSSPPPRDARLVDEGPARRPTSVPIDSATMSLTRDDVAHLASLARIDLSESELDRMLGELAVILDSVADVQQAPPRTSSRCRTRCRSPT